MFLRILEDVELPTLGNYEALLMKWIWRLYKDKRGDMVCEMLKAKYLKRTNYASYQGKNGSQFWKGINKLKNKFLWGASFVIKNGKKIKFWEDIWLKKSKLRDHFPRLYNFCLNKNALVSDCWDGSQ